MLNEKLINAFDESAGLRYNEYLSAGDEHRFSLSYRLNRKKIINDSKENNCTFKTNASVRLKTALIALAFSIVVLAGFISVAYVNGFRFSIYPDHSVVEIVPPDNAKEEITEYLRLSPKSGYTLTNESLSDSICTFEYKNGEKIVLLTQSLIDIPYHIDTEDASPQPVTFLGNEGFLISKDDDIQIIWTMDGYLFILVVNIDKNEAEDLFKTAKFENE